MARDELLVSWSWHTLFLVFVDTIESFTCPKSATRKMTLGISIALRAESRSAVIPPFLLSVYQPELSRADATRNNVCVDFCSFCTV